MRNPFVEKGGGKKRVKINLAHFARGFINPIQSDQEEPNRSQL